jgi:hypothetical protein
MVVKHKHDAKGESRCGGGILGIKVGQTGRRGGGTRWTCAPGRWVAPRARRSAAALDLLPQPLSHGVIFTQVIDFAVFDPS